jgi:hypothetical protein
MATRSAGGEGAAEGARQKIGEVRVPSVGTRELVTSQPEVVCGVCGRHLLRGEQAESFLADGDSHLVCDLCSVRARQLGWVPAAEVSLEPRQVDAGQRSRHALRDLLGRWRSGRARGPASGPGEDATGDARRTVAANSSSLEGSPASSASRGLVSAEREASSVGGTVGGADRSARGENAALLTAIEAFNNTEQPRRIAGIARSLGAPCMTARDTSAPASSEQSPGNPRSLSAHPQRVAIVAAWELCWYRWEVDLAGTWPSADLVASGAGFEELPPEDLAANAVVDERGMVSLASAPVRTP